MKTLLFQGDSITDCGREFCGRNGYPETVGWGPGYAGLIGSYLAYRQPGEWQVINRGISGNRIVDLYARWKVDCLNLAPDVVSILIGVNDTWHEKAHQNGVEVPRYEQFYRMLLDWTLEKLPKVQFVLLEPFLLPFGAADDSWVGEVRERAAVVRQIAADYASCTHFVPLQEPLNAACKRAPQEHWLLDGVHPMPGGHQLIAEAWLNAAGDLLK